MRTFHNNWTSKLATPGVTLGIGLLLAIVLATLPATWTAPIRDAAATLLRPGQCAALRLGRHGERATVWVKSHFRTAARLADAERELARLRHENQRFGAELAAARVQPPEPSGNATGDGGGRLLRVRSVTARVLGRQARAYLARRHLLDVGSAAGIEPDALVVASPAVIDCGRDADVQPGQLVLSGRRVWGKIVELGSHTSAVCAITEPGYRDLVAVGSRSGPQGILEGSGEPLARIRLVEVTEPVSVGDPVYTTAGQGVLSAPLLCGQIVRLERPVGNHWEIWMQPAVADQPEHVAVLRIELNPLRVAEKGTPARE